MKKNRYLSFGLLCLSLLSSYSCINQLESCDLAFYDFKVGEELSTCYELAKRDKEVHSLNLEKKGEFTIASFEVILPNYNFPTRQDFAYTVKGWAYSYAGRIFNIHLLAESELSRKSLPAMYVSRYGKRKENKGKTTWKFTNGSISLGEKTHKEKRKRLVNGWEKLKLHYIDSYYEEVEVNVFDGIYVDYCADYAKPLQRKLSKAHKKESELKYKALEEEWSREAAERKAAREAEERGQEEMKKNAASAIRF